MANAANITHISKRANLDILVFFSKLKPGEQLVFLKYVEILAIKRLPAPTP